LKKISKSSNKIIAERVDNGEQITLPYEQVDLLISRLYTVGEVAKIVERRSDTLRKYEKRGLIPSSEKFGEKYKSYKNWRFYDEAGVYELVSFFNDRVPGRPAKQKVSNIESKLKNIKEKTKVKL
jgi:hypothetical protein